MVRVEFKEGVPTCPCGSQEFKLWYWAELRQPLDASQGSQGWGIYESSENDKPVHYAECSNCDERVQLTKDFKDWLANPGGN